MFEDELYKLQMIKEGLRDIYDEYIYQFDTHEKREEIYFKVNILLSRYGKDYKIFLNGGIENCIAEINKKIEILKRNKKIEDILKDEIQR